MGLFISYKVVKLIFKKYLSEVIILNIPWPYACFSTLLYQVQEMSKKKKRLKFSVDSPCMGPVGRFRNSSWPQIVQNLVRNTENNHC